MSAVRHFALVVEITLLKRHLAVVTVAVGVLRGPSKVRLFPPTVRRERCFSAFSGLMSQFIFPYVHLLLFGTSDLVMNTMVFVPLVSLIPWASWPSSLAKERIHMSLSGPFMS